MPPNGANNTPVTSIELLE